ncbi:hypothetical protein [Burkholderia cepacia]|uniref:hypothetical protein n=1 Tax=Burkholderia cepacia TaxID=292 RepID=UPI001ABB19E7|nr:hypothetical protein [Burkholderia cepacia]
MSRSAGAAAKLPGSERKKLAVQALAGLEPISELSARLGVNRKFVYAQKDKASEALDDAFCSAVADDEVLFQLPVTRTWLRQVMVGLPLICRSSYRGVVEFMRDLLGVTVGVGSVDADSTYCYLLAAEDHRDGDTWGVRLLDAEQQGLAPEYTIADAGQGLRAGQRAAWGETPCHGDVFHIQRQCETLANTLKRLAVGARSQRLKLQARVSWPGRRGRARHDGQRLRGHAKLKCGRRPWRATSVRSPNGWATTSSRWPGRRCPCARSCSAS